MTAEMSSDDFNLRKQRSMNFNRYPSRPRTASREPEHSRPTTPASLHQQSPFPPRDDAIATTLTPQRSMQAFPGLPALPGPANDGRYTPPQPQSNPHQRPSEASRLRALNIGYRSVSSDGRSTPEQPENFSRPRQPSIRSRKDSPNLVLHSSNSFPIRSHDDQYAHAAMDARERGFSTSSSRSALNQHLIPLKPSISIPNFHPADSIHSRQRNLNNASQRPGRGLAQPDTNYSSHYREPIARPAGFDSDEVRASFKSAMTTNSSFMGTSGTERSSVMTKSSSATSIYGRDEGTSRDERMSRDDGMSRDEGMSVDDAIGMYESGFQDSGVEDSDDQRPETADSQRKRIQGLEEAMNDELVIPGKKPEDFGGERNGDLLPPNMLGRDALVRDSASFFRAGFTDPTTQPAGDGNMESDEEHFSQRFHGRPRTSKTTEKFDSTRDRYGFRKETQYVSLSKYEAWNEPYTDYLDRRKKKWVALQKENGLITDHPDRFPPKSPKVKRFVRKGIPPDWRGAAWFYFAGGPAMVAKNYGVYDDLVLKAAAGGVTETDDEIIERDLNRTFPDNIKFKPDPLPGETRDSHQIAPETPILQSLRRVLQAFSIYNPKIGYCQSLNFLAGLLLLFMNEEKSFWMLNIITRIYLPGTHEVNLEGANVDLGVLMTAIKDMMPSIWAKIGGELDGSPFSSQTMRLPPITLCTTAWFMSCFIGTLPIETTLRVWDSFFYEGSKTLFRIALTIFKIGEAEIKAVTDPMEIFQVVQTIPRRLIDANHVMESCFKRRNGFGHLSQESIEKGRAERRKGYALERERGEAGHDVPEATRPPGRKNTLFGRRRREATNAV